MTGYLTLTALAFFQNVAFTLVSRSRNRDHRGFHIVSSVLSNLAWFLTFKLLVVNNMGWDLFPFYLVGTTLGSEYGRMIAMRIERALFARSDAHVGPR